MTVREMLANFDTVLIGWLARGRGRKIEPSIRSFSLAPTYQNSDTWRESGWEELIIFVVRSYIRFYDRWRHGVTTDAGKKLCRDQFEFLSIALLRLLWPSLKGLAGRRWWQYPYESTETLALIGWGRIIERLHIEAAGFRHPPREQMISSDQTLLDLNAFLENLDKFLDPFKNPDAPRNLVREPRSMRNYLLGVAQSGLGQEPKPSLLVSPQYDPPADDIDPNERILKDEALKAAILRWDETLTPRRREVMCRRYERDDPQPYKSIVEDLRASGLLSQNEDPERQAIRLRKWVEYILKDTEAYFREQDLLDS